MQGTVGALIALGAGFNPILTGRENIYVNASVLGLSKREIDEKLDEIIDFAEIEDFIDSPVQNYSSGMSVRLGFAVAVTVTPDVLLLDEVLAVGDIKFRMKCYEAINQKINSGCTAILVSHNMIDISRVCNKGLLLDKGRTQYIGDVSNSLVKYQSILGQGRNTGESSGNVEFLSVSILDENGLEVDEIQTHDKVIIEATLKVNSLIKCARINFHLDSVLGRLTSMSTKHDGFDLDLSPPYVTVSFEIPKLTLLLGSYTAYFDVYGPEKSDFEAISGPIPLCVTAPPVDTYGYGVCHTLYLDHKWSLK